MTRKTLQKQIKKIVQKNLSGTELDAQVLRRMKETKQHLAAYYPMLLDMCYFA